MLPKDKKKKHAGNVVKKDKPPVKTSGARNFTGKTDIQMNYIKEEMDGLMDRWMDNSRLGQGQTFDLDRASSLAYADQLHSSSGFTQSPVCVFSLSEEHSGTSSGIKMMKQRHEVASVEENGSGVERRTETPCFATRERSLHIPTESSPHLPQLEKAHMQQRRLSAAKNKLIAKKKTGSTHKDSLDMRGTGLESSRATVNVGQLSPGSKQLLQLSLFSSP
ncbi:hypothetical protein MG293_017528 [Ovis ammon polii]|uniref:Uncharacterized protein n=1 Tax=Ovis ammon polii TaxID=230172 RepID=A0AAD4TQ18_OVIAM|nr:hypothetical protein MG293_017528 [Ovis ammon polii]